MVGCRERSKIASKNSKNARTKCRTRVFGERRRRKKTYLEVGPVGPRRPVGATRGQVAPAGRLGHWWPPWSAPGASGSLPAWKFLIYFFWNFLTTSLLKKFQSSKSCKTF